MQATYDIRRSSPRALAITIGVGASLILGAAGGFALKGLTQAALLSQPAPVVVSGLAGPMTNGHNAAQMTRIELSDQRSQAESGSVPTVAATVESNRASSRFGPR